MLPHRRYPLAEIQKVRSGEPLFEACFNFTHMHVYESLRDFTGVAVLNAEAIAETNFTLMTNFNVSTSSSQVELSLDCNATELCENQIEWIGGYYTRTLEAIANNPSARYEQNSLLAEWEQHLLAASGNGPARQPLTRQCIHHLFEAQVEKTPNAIAIAFDEEQLNYRELNARANQLARRLQALGVRAETPVALCLERSIDLIVGLLGILKAGGAYVPLDPTYPKERLQYMLEDSCAPVLLTQERLLETISRQSVHPILLDNQWESIARARQE